MIEAAKSEERVVGVLYKLALVALIPLVIVLFYLRTEDALNRLILGGMSCAFKRMTGINCPGCGGTRAAIYLAHFKFIESFKMNAAVIVGAVIYIVFIIWESLSRLFKIKGPREFHIYIMVAVLVGTIIIHWIFNIM